MDLKGFYHNAVALRTESEQLNQETLHTFIPTAFKSNYSSIKMVVY